MAAKNKEGLTFDEWLAAARFGRDSSANGLVLFRQIQRAWRRGEDPTEWAAGALAKSRQ